MNKSLPFVFISFFFITLNSGSVIAQTDHSPYIFAPDSTDSVTDGDRISSFVDGLLQKIESDVKTMVQDRNREHDEGY